MQYSHIKKIEIKKNENQEETRKLNSNESNAE